MKSRGFIIIVVSMLLGGGLVGCTAAMPTGTLVEYRRSGGFAGLDDWLVIDASGKATLTRRTVRSEFTLDQGTLSQLTALLDQAGFLQLRQEYLPSRKGADLFEYMVTYKGRTVRAMDTAVPDALWPALEFLNQIVERGGKP